MPAIVLTQQEVRDLLPMGECIELVARALTALARGQAQNPLRSAMKLPDGGKLLGMMPASLGSPRALGLKIVTVFPGNHGTPFDSHQGLVALFDPDDGRPILIADGSEITAIRTAAVSAVATRILAREDAHDLAIIGSGSQARTHLEAMRAVRPIERVRVHSLDRGRCEAFARRAAMATGIDVRVTPSAGEAVAGASIVCTVTSSRVPVVRGAWLASGAHVNAVGACIPAARELDADAVGRARVFVDSRESAKAEAGDILLARSEGAIDDAHVLGEIGELLCGAVEGRRSAMDVTLFKSLGLGVEDVIVAHHLHGAARARGVGVEVDLGGRRDG
ncbi:MAG: ornithine cyclodeaminase family protein [Acidobacteriota bacterium]